MILQKENLFEKYIEYLSLQGYKKKDNIIITHKSEYVELYYCQAGSTHQIIDIGCPINKIMLIRGKRYGENDWDLQLKLSDELDLSTTIRIVKNKSDDYVSYGSIPYNQILNGHLFKFPIELCGYGDYHSSDHLEIAVVSKLIDAQECPTCHHVEETYLPNIDILDKKIEFKLKVYVFEK